jgi:hypothetical protein
MKSNWLRGALRIKLSGYNSRRDQHAVIPDARHHRRQLNCRDADFLPHRNRADGDFGPSICRLCHATRFSRELDSCLLTEAKCSNVLVKTFVA